MEIGIYNDHNAASCGFIAQSATILQQRERKERKSLKICLQPVQNQNNSKQEGIDHICVVVGTRRFVDASPPDSACFP